MSWSLLVKLRAGNRCEYCGTTNQLNSHHIHTRRKRATRWDVLNGICLCVMHHTGSVKFSAHETPHLFNQWLVKYKGRQFVDELTIKANSINKLMPFEKEELLKGLNEEIKRLQNVVK